MQIKGLLTALVMIAALGVGGAWADVLVLEDFDYDISSDASLAGKGGGSDGWDGAWSGSSGTVVDVSGDPLSAAGVSGGNQALRSANLNSNSFANRAIAASAGISDDVTVWISYLLRWEAGTKNNGERVHLYSTQSNWDHRYFGVNPDSADSDFALSRAYNNKLQGGGEFAVGDTVLLVMKLTSDGSSWTTHDLWINPTSEGATGGGDITTSASGWGSIPGLGLTHRANNDTFLFDRIRVGESFADVAIPEPATLSLLGLAGLSLLRRRCR